MGYKIDPITGKMSEYIFDFGGILALRNFTAKTIGDRLIIHSAQNANFTILEALVSEVEIDGVIYDNAQAAQEALQRLVFNPVIPVIMTLAQQQLLEGAMQRGEYSGTASDLIKLLEKKIKEIDLSGKLDKGTYNGTGQDLKQAIDNINTVLQSDDSTLDDLQEIVNYIKVNKNDLKNLSIDNIAGLVDALASKSATNHTHSEYALLSHTHSWNDIENKPTDLATTQNIIDAINGIKMSGRNLLRNTLKPNLQNWKHSDNTSIELGQLDIFGGTDAFRLRINNDSDFYFSTIAGNVYAVKVLGKYTVSFYAKSNRHINMPVTVSGVVKSVDITSEWQKYDIIFDVQSPTSYKDLEFAGSHSLTGNMGLELYFSHIKLVKEHEDWSPAIEDIYQQIDDIRIGGRNLLRRTQEFSVEGGDYEMLINYAGDGGVSSETFNGNVVRVVNSDFQGYRANIPYLVGEPIIISFWAKSRGAAKFNNFAFNHDPNNIQPFLQLSNNGDIIGDNQWHRYYMFNSKGMSFGKENGNGFVEFYNISSNVLVSSIKIEKGNKVTDDTPAPEDFYNEINTNVLKINTSVKTSQKINGYSQNGRNIVSTGGDNIIITVDSSDGFCATYQKIGTGNIMFGAGANKTLVQVDNTNTVNGAKGSTATVTVVDDDIILRISNV